MKLMPIIAGATALALLAGCETAPSGPSARLDEGLIAYKENRLGDARAHFESMLADDPNNPYVHLSLGAILAEQGDVTAAARHYNVAAANGANSPVRTAVVPGSSSQVETTVEKVAQENLAALGS